jgi:hypothetical protein
MGQVDCDVLPLRIALKHTFERELAADATFFVAAVGVTRANAEYIATRFLTQRQKLLLIA